MMGTKIDTSSTPAWDLTLTIRGVAVPTRSPLDAEDRATVNLGARRPGVIVRLWRWLFGDPRRVVEDAHETEELRRTVAAVLAPAHAGVVRGLSGGELLAALGSYLGAQSAWFEEIQRQARAEAERAFEAMGASRARADAAAAPAASVTAAGPGVQRHRVAPMKLKPGMPLPAWLAGGFDRAEGTD